MYNHTGLQGRLTADPELRHTPSGVAITSFRLASDTGRKTKDGQKITNFIDCVAWRAQAEFVSKYLTKGRLVLVEGELTSRNYEDKDGNHRKATEITVSSVHFCDSKKDGRRRPSGHRRRLRRLPGQLRRLHRGGRQWGLAILNDRRATGGRPKTSQRHATA